MVKSGHRPWNTPVPPPIDPYDRCKADRGHHRPEVRSILVRRSHLSARLLKVTSLPWRTVREMTGEKATFRQHRKPDMGNISQSGAHAKHNPSIKYRKSRLRCRLVRRKGDGRRGIANVSKGRDEESETLIGYQDLHLPIGFDFKNMYRYKKEEISQNAQKSLITQISTRLH